MIKGNLNDKVPFEILESILNALDAPYMPSCSLVCRSWLPICRPRLFKHLILDIRSPEKLLDFVSALGSAHLTFRKSVQELTFKIMHHQEQPVVEPDDIESLVKDMDGKFPSLTKLSVVFYGKFLDIKSTSDNLYTTFTTVFNHIHELEIQTLYEEPMVLIGFIRSFPYLDVLKLRTESVRKSDAVVDLPPSLYPPPVSLTMLQHGGMLSDWYGVWRRPPIGAACFYERWLQECLTQRIRSLSVHKAHIGNGHSTFNTPAIEKFLVHNPELRCLHIGLDQFHVERPGERDLTPYNLSDAQRLERLILSFWDLSDNESRLLKTVPKMLNTLTSPCLQKIVLTACGDGFSRLVPQWDAIDIILSSSMFTAVAIEVIVPLSHGLRNSDEETSEDLTRLREVFPRCDEQGRLSAVRAPFITAAGEGGHRYDESHYYRDQEMINWVIKRS
ncbi:hypothetical protein PQX77_020429 [Marasmius sp. AFHP31]|nr:hypothetical protein PQX77_020429 [Marasmius sp. AFHP31]